MPPPPAPPLSAPAPARTATKVRELLAGDRLLEVIPLAAVAILAVAFGAKGWQGTYFTADSYYYYELARTVFGDFYRIDTIRSFESVSDFGSSFPLGWPVMLALGDLVVDPGVRTGLVLNAILLVVGAWLAERLFARHTAIRGLGALSVVAMCGLGFFADEVVSGRSMPATLVLLLLLLLQLPVDTESRKSMGVLGLTLAALTYLRFDWLWPALLLPALFVALANRRRVAPLLTCYAALAIVLLPWVIYSLVHFGTPFASDNSQVALSTETQHAADYVPVAPPTALEDPVAWVERVASNVPFLVDTITGLVKHAFVVFLILVVGLLAVVALHRRWSGTGGSVEEAGVDATTPATRRQLVVLVAVLAVQGAFPALVLHYDRFRYWSMVVFLVLVAACLFTVRSPRFGPRGNPRQASALVAGFVGLFVAGILTVGPLPATGGQRSFSEHADRGETLAGCVDNGERVMVLAQRGTPDAYAIGALSGQQMLALPRNFGQLRPSDIRRLVSDYRVQHLLLADGSASVRRTLGTVTEALGPGHAPSRERCRLALYRVP